MGNRNTKFSPQIIISMSIENTILHWHIVTNNTKSHSITSLIAGLYVGNESTRFWC